MAAVFQVDRARQRDTLLPGSFFFSRSLSPSPSPSSQLFNPLPRGSRSNCRERFARNVFRRDAPGERTTDGVKKSVKRIRDARRTTLSILRRTRERANRADRFCIFISVRAVTLCYPSSLFYSWPFLSRSSSFLSPPFFRFRETAAWSIKRRLSMRIITSHFNIGTLLFTSRFRLISV